MTDESIVNPAVEYLQAQYKKLLVSGASSRHTPTEIADKIRADYKTTPQRVGVVSDLIINRLTGMNVPAKYEKLVKKRFFILQRENKL